MPWININHTGFAFGFGNRFCFAYNRYVKAKTLIIGKRNWFGCYGRPMQRLT